MADYQDIRGLRVKYLSGDPSVTVAGEVWYNSTTGTLRSRLVTEAWSAGANTINLTNAGGSAGTQPTGLIFGGRNPTVPAFVSTAEEYNGAGWAAGGALNTARSYIAGFGVQTAAVGAGGRTDAPGTITAATEEYDGSTWTTNPSPSGDLGSARNMQNGGVGIQAAGLGVGPSATEEYGGTTWTAGGALNTARSYLTAFGTQTAAAAAGGHTPPGAYSDAVEEYNGTSWTSVTSIPAIRQSAAAAGTQTDGLIFGGELTGATATNTALGYDGSTWSAKPNMANSGFAGAGQGTAAAALASNFRGTPGVTRNTEEFNRSANVITAGAWAAGGALPTVIYRGASFGTLTAGVNTGGDNTAAQPSVTTTSEYDGSTWTVGGVLATARRGLAASGVQTLGLAFGGSDGASDANVTGVTEEYGGTSWTTSPGSLNTARSALSGDGTQGASIAAGGYLGPPTANSDSAETYDGATWTAITNIPSVRRWPTTSGTTTAALVSGGETAPGTQLTTVSEWNGASWSEGGALLVTTSAGASAGTQTDALFFAGRTPSYTGAASGYDGTAWSTRPSMATARAMVGGTGVSTSAFVCGGEAPGLSALTEEFTGETSAANIETLTTS